MSKENDFKADFHFNIGDIVYDTTNKRYGLVLNNYADSLNGDGGEIRLDSDGNQCIFTYTKDFKDRIGYNLLKQDLSMPKIKKLRDRYLDNLRPYKENYKNQKEL